ncbi:efflux RND transporter permease subunit [Halomonas sp. PA16-9]|uniref:efflux RND transporter permease subunit n=1 Tax=Halomonas sp. PA16-9 TaxID=2576841 RepID=UPI003FA54892
MRLSVYLCSAAGIGDGNRGADYCLWPAGTQSSAAEEYPTIDPPVVTIDTRYPEPRPASSKQDYQVLEDRIAGVEGIELITSQSEDGRSQIEIEFALIWISMPRNDIRDRISGALRNLPDDADNPEVTKADSSEEVVVG